MKCVFIKLNGWCTHFYITLVWSRIKIIWEYYVLVINYSLFIINTYIKYIIIVVVFVCLLRTFIMFAYKWKKYYIFLLIPNRISFSTSSRTKLPGVYISQTSIIKVTSFLVLCMVHVNCLHLLLLSCLQGDIPLDVPCLRNDYPVVLLDQNRVKEWLATSKTLSSKIILFLWYCFFFLWFIDVYFI